MSTRRSVDRSAVTSEEARSAVTSEEARSAVTPEKNRANLCSFTFADGRRCRTPRSSSHPHFCYFHARKQAQAQAAVEIGSDISYYFSGEYLSASDLSSALGRLFAAVAEGQVKPRTASALAYLGQTLLQSIQLAQHEYIGVFGPLTYRETVKSSVKNNFEHNRSRTDHGSDQDPGQEQEQALLPGTVASSE